MVSRWILIFEYLKTHMLFSRSRGQANSYVHGICRYSKHTPRAGAAAVAAMASAVASVTMLTMKGAVQSEKNRYQI